MNHKSLPTVDELIGILKRSNLPTIILEGSDDVFIYRWLSTKVDCNLVSLLPCGGRNTLFSVFDRRSEFLSSNVVFIADKDLFKFEGVPDEKSEVIFTSGYSIENDIYCGSSIDEFIDNEDRQKFDLLKEIIGKWFAFEIQRHMDSKAIGEGCELTLASHINVISPIGSGVICPVFSSSISYVTPREEFLNLVNGEYTLNVRGKQLFQMLSRYLSSKGRFSKFSDKNLIEIALKQGNNNYLEAMVSSINGKLVA